MKTSTGIRIVCCQFGPRIGDVAGNLKRITNLVAAANAMGADLVVLPELATSGYVFESRSELRKAAISSEDPCIAELVEAVGPRATVVFGFAERSGGDVYNSAMVIDNTGVVAVQRKSHLWNREVELFNAGEGGPQIITTRWGLLGILICYELEFPEMPRKLGVAGADVIAVPTNWPLLARPADERAPEVIAGMAAARGSGVYIACCDRNEVERGQAWTEGTVIVGADGWILSEADIRGIAVADVDLTLARNKRRSIRNHLMSDRRPKLYG